MHPVEEQFLSQIEKCPRTKPLLDLPLGTLSKEFYTDPRVKTYCAKNNNQELNLRCTLEEYIGSGFSPQHLENIEAAILQLSPPMLYPSGPREHLQNKAAGTYLMPLSSALIRQVYLSEDFALSKLFQKHFPMPPAQLFLEDFALSKFLQEHSPIPPPAQFFNEEKVPALVQEREAEILRAMEKIDVKKSEPFIIKKQRRVRMKRRHQEEINRIAQKHESYLKSLHMPLEELKANNESGDTLQQLHERANELIQDANTPYRPQCNPILADRIMSAAKKVAAFSTVKHITSITAVQSIFNDALYGARTLHELHLSFKRAALEAVDVLNGDGNAVCLAPQQIDHRVQGELTIEFDLPKLIHNKPSAFYKQRDFGYALRRSREVQLGKETISFVQGAAPPKWKDSENTYLFIPNGDSWLSAKVPHASLISYNLEQMHEILTLNFFRFLDRMSDAGDQINHAYIDDFYRKVGLLTEEELVLFLTDLEMKMTDTAEFNFYGAHKIDFSTIKKIHMKGCRHPIDLPQIIHGLKEGNATQLEFIEDNLSELLQSYRFLDYLLSQTPASDVKDSLHKLREQRETPTWMKNNSFQDSVRQSLFGKSEALANDDLISDNKKTTNRKPF